MEQANNELVELMKEMVRLQKILAKPVLKNLIKESLDKPEKVMVYDLTDGERSREEIIKLTDAGAGTISGWWIEWLSKGILEKNGNKYKKLISLEEIGIKVPQVKNKQINEKQEVDMETGK